MILKYNDNIDKSSEKGGFNTTISFRIINTTKSNLFLKLETNFWNTFSKDNIPAEYLWLEPEEKKDSQKNDKLPKNYQNCPKIVKFPINDKIV